MVYYGPVERHRINAFFSSWDKRRRQKNRKDTHEEAAKLFCLKKTAGIINQTSNSSRVFIHLTKAFLLPLTILTHICSISTKEPVIEIERDGELSDPRWYRVIIIPRFLLGSTSDRRPSRGS